MKYRLLGGAVMENVIRSLVAGIIAWFSISGVLNFAFDSRYLSDIEKQCRERGYIQNTKTRINCSIEESQK